MGSSEAGEWVLHATPRSWSPGTLPSQPRCRPDAPRLRRPPAPSTVPSRGVIRRCTPGHRQSPAGSEAVIWLHALSHGAATCRAWSAVRAGGSLPRPLPRQPKGSLSSGFIPLRTAVCHRRCPLNPLLIHSCVSEGVAPRLRRPPPKNEQRRLTRPEALIVARSLVGAKELDTSFLKDFNLKTQKQQHFSSVLSYEKMEWCLSGHQDFRNAQNGINGGPANAWDQ